MNLTAGLVPVHSLQGQLTGKPCAGCRSEILSSSRKGYPDKAVCCHCPATALRGNLRAVPAGTPGFRACR